jgi:hypothetical protein
MLRQDEACTCIPQYSAVCTCIPGRPEEIDRLGIGLGGIELGPNANVGIGHEVAYANHTIVIW